MQTFKSKIRVISAIAAKDLLDAVKNRGILSLLCMALMIVALYRFLPNFEQGESPPRLVVYDQGTSKWVASWDSNPEFDLVMTASHEEMVRYIGDKDLVVLGLVLPEDFDQRIAQGKAVTLNGYVAHWASDEAVDTVRTFFENALTQSVTQPIHFDLDGNIVHTRIDSQGFAFMAALSVLLALSMGGMYIIPHLIFEEKQTRTMDTLLVSPATRAEFLIGKALAGGVIASLAGMLAMAVNAVLVTQWWVAIIACLSGALFFVAVGLLVGTVLDNKQQMALWGFLLMFLMIVPGLLVTLGTFLKEGVLTLLRFTPSVALINLVRVSFSQPIPIHSLGSNLILLVGWAAAIYLFILFLLSRKDRANV